jgi:hypothetical protein
LPSTLPTPPQHTNPHQAIQLENNLKKTLIHLKERQNQVKIPFTKHPSYIDTKYKSAPGNSTKMNKLGP